MKNRYISSFMLMLMLLVLSCKSDAYKSFPDYTEVVNKFYAQYANENATLGAVSFEKRKEGWYAAFNDYSSGKAVLVQTWKIWSADGEKYEELKFTGVPDTRFNEQEKAKALRQENTVYYFRISPYFGYVGWDKDVINEFDGRNDLPDSVLFSVAHAHSTRAMNLLGNNYGLADENDQFKLEEKPNCMSQEQLKEYRKYEHRAIELMEEVEKMNPKYQTFVGDIHNKVSNEYMNAFLTLLYYQNEEEAIKEIRKDLYNPFFISTAKNYLSSCEKNAVLFTNGDNDTYPLLYVQAKLGFRRDVKVINLSLFNLSRYINVMRGKVFDAPALQLTLPMTDYKDEKFAVVYASQTENAQSCTMNAREIIPFLKNRNRWISLGKEMVPAFYCNRLLLEAGSDTLIWDLRRSYIYKSELAVLDLLATEGLSRPVYFASTTSEESWLGLQKYMKLEGFAYRIGTTRNGYGSQEVNEDLMYEKMMNTFTYEGLSGISSETERRFAANYMYSASTLTWRLIELNRKDSAMKLADKFLSLFPDRISPLGIESARLAEVYFIQGHPEKALPVINAILENTRKNEKDKERSKSIYSYFAGVAEQYNQPGLKKTCETALTK